MDYPTDASSLWDVAVAQLQWLVPRVTYQMYLRDSRPLGWDREANAWTIGVPRAGAEIWLAGAAGAPVRQAVARLTPGLPEPTIVYEQLKRAAPENPVRRPARRKVTPPGGGTPAPAAAAAARPEVADGGDSPSGPASPRPGGPKRAAAQSPGAGPLDFTDLYIKIKLAFRREALRLLRGCNLSVWLCLALHMNMEGISSPGLETIMRETGLSRTTVCRALVELCSPELRFVEKLMPRDRVDRYQIRSYAWMGGSPARTPLEPEPRRVRKE